MSETNRSGGTTRKKKKKGFFQKLRVFSIPIITLLLALIVFLSYALIKSKQKTADQEKKDTETIASLTSELDGLLSTAVYPSGE